MTTTEIKAAWNTFKKEAKKEIRFDMSGCCYMNAKQIANGTATIALCSNIEYDEEIEYQRNSNEKVNGYNTWTTEEKKNHENRCLDRIANQEQRKAAYGNKENEAKKKAAEIIISPAFQKLAKAIDLKLADVELVHKWGGLYIYQLRLNY